MPNTFSPASCWEVFSEFYNLKVTSKVNMSWRATAHVKPLTKHADGTPLSAREKLILFVLADSHNDDYDYAWPGLTRAAEQSLTSRRRFIDLMKRLEDRGTITVERREGRSNLYRFPGLVQSSHPLPVPELHPTSAVVTAPPSATATAPKPLSSLEGTDIQPRYARPVIEMASEAIRESQRTGENADKILERLRAENLIPDAGTLHQEHA